MRKKSTPVKFIQPDSTAIPEHLILDHILPRLPVKSLIRFKSVSKTWQSTISSETFIKTHFEFSSRCPKALLLESCFINKSTYIISFDERSNNLKEFGEMKFETLSNHGCLIVGSCDGLVCLYDENLCFYLWNPAIGESIEIESPDIDYHERFTLFDVRGVGFGYVSSIDDYRIGFMLTSDEILYHVFMFSSRAGEWSLMGCVHFETYIDRENEAVLVDDTLYWSPEVPKRGCNETHVVGLDLVSGQLNKFPVIDILIGYDKVQVYRMKGHLAFGCVKNEEGKYHSDFTDVWVMKHRGDWTSWEKKFSIDIRGSELCCIYETGKCLVGWKTKLKLLDPFEVAPEDYEDCPSVWQELRTPNMSPTKGGWGYHESLISLDTIMSDNQD